MAIIGFIVLGDRTSHGGVVISGDPTWTIDGQPVARFGDKVTCPRCKRVSTIVSSRFPTVIDLGKPMAYDQDMTDCGAVIYSRHNNHAGWDEKGRGDEAASTPIRGLPTTPTRTTTPNSTTRACNGGRCSYSRPHSRSISDAHIIRGARRWG